MGFALKSEQEYSEICCGECGISFYVVEHWRHARQVNGQAFYCPNGHCRAFKRTIVEEPRITLAEKERLLEWEKSRADSLDKRLKGETQKHQRLQKRVAAGVCPHCHRTFKQLASHMHSKHPEQLERRLTCDVPPGAL